MVIFDKYILTIAFFYDLFYNLNGDEKCLYQIGKIIK